MSKLHTTTKRSRQQRFLAACFVAWRGGAYKSGTKQWATHQWHAAVRRLAGQGKEQDAP